MCLFSFVIGSSALSSYHYAPAISFVILGTDWEVQDGERQFCIDLTGALQCWENENSRFWQKHSELVGIELL